MSTAEVTEIGPSKHRLRISVDAAEIADAWKKNLQEVASSVSLPGFRRGKVPAKIIESRYAKELESQVTESLIAEHFEKTIEEKGLSPLSEPSVEEVDFDRQEGLNVSLVVEVRPEFDVKDYKGIKLERPAATVEDDAVDEAVTNIRRQRATLETSEKPSAKDQHILGTAAFTVDGNEVLKKDHAHLHVGHDHVGPITVEGLGKKLLKLSAGDTVTHETTLGDDFPEAEHRGAKATVTIEVNEIKTEKLPELDEEFFKTLGVDDEAQLKERIREELTSGRENEIREEVSEKLLDAIAQPLDLPIPEDLLRRQCLNLVRQGEAVYRVAMKPQEEQEAALNEEIEAVKEVAQTQVRNYFILEKIAEAEKIFVTEREVAQQIAMMAAQQGVEPEAMMTRLREQGGLTEIRLGLRERKTVDWLLEKADITEVDATPAGGTGKTTSSTKKTKKKTTKKKSTSGTDKS